MDYFLARVFHEALEKLIGGDKTPIEQSYLNVKVLDPEKGYTCDYLAGMILRNLDEQVAAV